MLRGDFLKDYHPIQGERGGGVIIILVVSHYRNRDRLQLAGWVTWCKRQQDLYYSFHQTTDYKVRTGSLCCVLGQNTLLLWYYLGV